MSDQPAAFGLGWHPDFAAAANARLLASRQYCEVRAGLPDPPPAWSLSKYRLRHLEQLSAGTCWVHAAVQLAEVSGNSLGYKPFPICRRLAAWEGKRLEGGGNPSNGGSPTDALIAMTDTQGKGVGMAHESLWPYTDNYNQLAQPPSQAVLADGQKSHLVMPVRVRSADEAKQLIAAGHPCAIGIWWTYYWDQHQALFSQIGNGEYGHALLEIGYVSPGVWDNHAWWQLDNWHGLLYPPLPADKASRVPGYQPISAKATSDFWVRDDVYKLVQSKGPFEHVSATDLSGLDKVVSIPSFTDAFPI